MKYFDAVNFINNRPVSKGDHTLEKIEKLLDFFDNPQDKIRIIHIAGTNGKGSTTRFLASVFSRNYKTGSFTSPYIARINENISIDGKEISDEQLSNLVQRLEQPIKTLDKEGYYLSYFEIITAIMYIYFYEQSVDVAIVETGLGGLLDCTNIIKKPIASVITTISMDHTNILGNDIRQIAYQKAGIIKENVPVFIYPQKDEVMNVFLKKTLETNSKLYSFTKNEINIKKADENANVFDFRNYKDVNLQLLGIHQIYNACLALMVIDYFKNEFCLDENDIKQSLSKADNPGRITYICKSPRVLVDGSHNEESIDALIETLKYFSYDRLIVGFSVLKDKDYNYIIKQLSKIADYLIVTNINNPRAFDFDSLSKIVEAKREDVVAIEDSIKAYEYSKEMSRKGDLILWCGSLYLISELINYENSFNN